MTRELRETIAIFFGNIIRDKTNSVFPCFSPKKSVFSGHEWLRFECRANRDILEAMNDRNTLTLQGEKQWKTEVDLNNENHLGIS